MSERIILPDDVVEVGGFDVMVKFPSDEERPPVIVKHVRRNWAVATFEERLFKALNNEDDKKNTTSSSSKSRGGPYLLLTELAGVVIAMVDPWNNRIAHDLSSLGSYGIDSSTNLKLVVPNGDMVDIINQDIEILRKQHDILKRKQLESNALISGVEQSKQRHETAKMEKVGLGKTFRDQCRKVVKEAMLSAAMDVIGNNSRDGGVGRNVVTIHWKDKLQNVSLDSETGKTLTCGDLAKGACMYFQQDVDGAALQDHPHSNKVLSDDIPLWSTKTPIEVAIMEAGTCHFNLYVYSSSSSSYASSLI
jgi:hypothetical protein